MAAQPYPLGLHARLGDLPTFDLTIAVDAPVRDLADAFQHHPDLPGAMVETGGRLTGVVSRARCMERLGHPLGADLFLKRPVEFLLEEAWRHPLILDGDTPVDAAARSALERPRETVYEPVVIRKVEGGLRLIDMQTLILALARMQALQNEELVRTQRSLVRAEKMASLSRLVAGVAHEINTPIGVTLTAASHLAGKTHDLRALFEEGTIKRGDLRAYLDAAEETGALMLNNIERAASLIQSFKLVAVDQASNERRRFPLKAYLHEILLSLGPKLKPGGHRVEVDCPDDLELNGYPGAISMIITNLVVNALTHAYPEGARGRLSIHARTLPCDMVELCFGDDGRGIPEAEQERVFDPFYTTASGAGGSGLGLHIVYNLVHAALLGEITLESMVGMGTTFVIHFPRVTPEEARPARSNTEVIELPAHLWGDRSRAERDRGQGAER